MNYVVLYRDPNVKIYNVIKKIQDCENEKLMVPKTMLIELLNLYKLSCSKKFEYNVQKETLNYLLKGFRHIKFLPENNENISNFIEKFLQESSEENIKELYNKMITPEKGYAPFSVASIP
jgi:hypothetical protein